MSDVLAEFIKRQENDYKSLIEKWEKIRLEHFAAIEEADEKLTGMKAGVKLLQEQKKKLGL